MNFYTLKFKQGFRLCHEYHLEYESENACEAMESVIADAVDPGEYTVEVSTDGYSVYFNVIVGG